MFIFFDFATTKLLQIFGIYKVFCEKITSLLAQAVFFFLIVFCLCTGYCKKIALTLPVHYQAVTEVLSRQYRGIVETTSRVNRDNPGQCSKYHTACSFFSCYFMGNRIKFFTFICIYAKKSVPLQPQRLLGSPMNTNVVRSVGRAWRSQLTFGFERKEQWRTLLRP